jgi:hypothetical protein
MTITLVNNLDNHRAPASLQLEYTLPGAVHTWNLNFAGPLPQGVVQITPNGAVPVGAAPANPVTVANVQSRTLIAHYPTAPNTVRNQVSSVQA